MSPAPLRKVVVDVSAPDKAVFAEVSASQVAAVLQAEQAGTITAEAATEKIAELRQAQKDVAAAPDRVKVEPLTDDDRAELEEVQAASAAQTERAAAALELHTGARERLGELLPKLRTVAAGGAEKDIGAVTLLAQATVELAALLLGGEELQ